MAMQQRDRRSADSPQALVYVQIPASFYFNCLGVEMNCYRAPVVVNNVENDGAERVEASWTNGVLSSGISWAGELVSPGQ